MKKYLYLLLLGSLLQAISISCTKDSNIVKNIQVCRNNVLITIPETQRLLTDLDKCPDFDKIRTDLQANMTLKSYSKIAILFIYVGYKKDIKPKLEDIFFSAYKNDVEKNLNILASNIINHTTFKNGLIQLDGTTNRKIEIVLSDFAFSDEEINNMSVSSINSFLNNSSIRNSVKSLNIKRIKIGIPPIVQVYIMVGSEVSSKSTNLTATSSTDGFGITIYGNPPNYEFYKGMLAPSGLLHECFWHMISNDHQKKVLRFVKSPTGVDYLKYFQEIINTDDNTGNSIRSMFYTSGGTAIMLENGMSSFINRNYTVNLTNSVLKLDTIFLKSDKGIVQTLEFQDALYDGNANRKLWESKYNIMVLKYIDMFMASEYGK